MIEIFVQPAFTRLALESTHGLTVQDLITNNTHKENFNDDNNNFSIGDLLWRLIWLGLSIYAVYLSWNCESNKVYSTVTRVFFACFAWFFGIFYIGVNYMFFNDCKIPTSETTYK
jgi:hypothetical protein